MAHFLNNKCCKLVCISAIALTSLSSCMKDDLTGCPTPKLSLKFDYTYNVKEADAFSAEVKNRFQKKCVRKLHFSVMLRNHQ